MNSKTLKLIEGCLKIIKEQGEMPDMSQEMPADPSQDVQNSTEPVSNETMPMTSAGEDKYISDLIDAALFEPSPEQANTLNNLRSVMDMKKYKNAREEVLPSILGMISAQSSQSELKNQLNKI